MDAGGKVDSGIIVVADTITTLLMALLTLKKKENEFYEIHAMRRPALASSR